MKKALNAALATLLLALPVVGGGQTRAASSLASLETRPEKTAYRETSRYADVVAFMEAVAQAAPRIHLTTFGYTFEGRPLPLAVVGAPDASPEAVRKTGKLRVYIQGNIHGGEVEGKESAQMLLRDLAQGKHADWLQSMVLLIAPIYNADGNERISLTNRGRQHGPIGGMGQRPNAQDLDLNRDHMKLDSPEARSVVKLMNDYDPHVSMDLHTTNGSYHAYHVTYAPPLNPATDPAIIEMLRKEWLPAFTKTIKAKYGWDYYYYGNVSGGGRGRGGRGGGRGQAGRGGPPPVSPPAVQQSPEAQPSGDMRSWATFDHRPRFNNNYIGLRNRIALLSEAYSYATFEDRVLATNRFVDENLDYAHAHVKEIQQLTAGADKRPIVGSTLPVRAELERAPEPVEILMGEVAEERNPYSGQMMYRRVDVKRPEKMYEMGTFRATDTERVPAVYFVPPNLSTVIDRIQAHGIATTTLDAAGTVQIEEFKIEAIELAARPFQNRTERTLRGTWTALQRELPAGTLRIDMTQPLARLAFYLLEPRSDDGLANWNLVDGLEANAEAYPIVRTAK
ncbi:MAG TPA: M14 family metallopeptidase [Vicinamibacterales bacterium]|nr:M14 family metallopeptidase [Vicinamibacterales bacterium]